MIWNDWLQLWTIRNQAIHGSTYTESQFLVRQKLLHDIRHIIERRHHVESNLRDSVPSTPSEPDRWTTTRLSAWFSIYHDTVTQSISSFALRCVNGIRTITQYFPRQTAPSEVMFHHDSHVSPWEGGLRPPPSTAPEVGTK